MRPIATCSALIVPSVVALAALATTALPASADVLVQSVTGGSRDRLPILVSPDGAQHPLADPGGSDDDRDQTGAVSPDRSLVARTSGTGIGLLPVDGGASRVVGPVALRSTVPEDTDAGGSYLSFGVGRSMPSVWWDAEGRYVLRDDVRSAAGRPVVLSCEVDSGRCTTRPAPRGLFRVGSRRDGGSLWTAGLPVAVVRLEGLDALGRWRAATGTVIRRARAALRRPVFDGLVVASRDGVEAVLSRARRSPAAGLTDFSPSEDGDGGTIVARSRTAYSVQTRRRNGRLQARFRAEEHRQVPWRIDATGRRTSLAARSPDGDRLTAVGAAAGARGWIGLAEHSDGGAAFPVTVGADGEVRRLLVGGRPATARALHAALGLSPRVPARSTFEDLHLPGYPEVAGYEAATDSAVVTYYDATADSLRQIVVRLPLSGAPPSLVIPPAPKSSDDLHSALVTAW